MSGGLFVNSCSARRAWRSPPGARAPLSAAHAAAYSRSPTACVRCRGRASYSPWLTDAGVPWAIATSGRVGDGAVTLAALGVDPDDAGRHARPGARTPSPTPTSSRGGRTAERARSATACRRRRQHMGHARRDPLPSARRRPARRRATAPTSCARRARTRLRRPRRSLRHIDEIGGKEVTFGRLLALAGSVISDLAERGPTTRRANFRDRSEGSRMIDAARQIVWFEEITRHDVARVGGKNASLGEMVGNLTAKGVSPARICDDGRRLLALHRQQWIEGDNGRGARRPRSRSPIARRSRPNHPPRHSARQLVARNGDAIARPTATCADAWARRKPTSRSVRARPRKTFPTPASRGSRRPISTFGENRPCSMPVGAASPRSSPIARSAIARRKGFDHMKVALSVGVQSMVRSDIGGAGVMFSHRHRNRFRQDRPDQRGLGSRRECRSGRRRPGRICDVQAVPLRRRAVADRGEKARRQGGQDDLRTATATIRRAMFRPPRPNAPPLSSATRTS